LDPGRLEDPHWHKKTIVACVRVTKGRKVERECRTFDTTTSGLLALLSWLVASRCTHVAMEATGVYWKPVWNILSDGGFELIVANGPHQECSRPQDRHERRDVDRRSGRLWFDQGKLCAG
jgi:Transposase